METEDNMEIESHKSGEEPKSDFDDDFPEQHKPTYDDFDEGQSSDSESQDELHNDFIQDNEDDFVPELEEEDEPEEEEQDFIEEEEEEESEIYEETPRYSVQVQNIENGYCEVCYSSVTPKFLQPECQHLFDLISCKSCGIKTHHICHGMGTPVEETTDELGNRIKYFLCDACKQTSQEKEKKCFICNNHEGCLRLSRDKKFIHPLCGIGSSSIAFRDVTTMDIDLSSFRKRGTTIGSASKCRICRNKIETHPCVNEKSNKHCHLHCALRFKLLKPRKNYWKIWFSLLPEEDLKFTHLISEEAILGNLEDITVKLKRVIGKTGMDTALRFPMEIKQRRKGSRYRKKVGKDRTEASIFLQELFDKAKKTVAIDFEEDDVNQKDLQDQNIGGKFIVIDTDELTREEQELLEEDELEEYDEDVLYHIERLNPFDSISELIKSFYKEIENANSLLEVYSEDKIPKLRKNLETFPILKKLTFPELLFFINVFQRRVQAALNHLCDLEDLQKLITSASIFPFSLISMIQLLNKKYHTAVATDHLLAPYISHCEPLSAYDATQKSFNEKIVASNEKAIQQAFQIKNVYTHKPCKSITQQFKDLQTSYRQLVFLKEFNSELAGYFSSKINMPLSSTQGLFIPQEGLPIIPLSKLLSLYAKANRLKLDEHFEEFQLLKQLIGESTDLLGIDETQEFGETDFQISGKPSPRGTPKVAEIFPISAVPLGSHRRGRPPREDKLANKIEKDYQIQLNRVKAFQNLQDIENDFINAREDQDQDQIQHLEATLAKARDWQDKFRQSIQNKDGTLGSLVERIESIKFYFDEIGEALRLRRDWSLWRLRVIAISRRLNKKRQKYLGEIDEMVDLEELEKVIDMEQDIIHLEPNNEAFQEIKDRFYQAQQIHSQLQNEEKPFSFAELKDLRKSLKELNIRIPESNSLQRRLIANENLQRLIETPLSLKKLEDKLNYLKDISPKDLDSELLKKITDKINEGKDLKLKAQEILSHAPHFSVQELKRMARLLKIHEEFNIETEETEKMQKYLNEFLRLLKAYSIITNSPLVDLKSLESQEETGILSETIESIIQTCQTALNENLDNIDEGKAEKLDETFRWFHPELIENSKLKDFFDFLSIKLWKAKARIYLQTNYPRTLSTIQKFIAEIPHIEQLTREDYTSVKNIQQIIKRINKWKEDASEITQNYSKEKLLDFTETSQLNQVGADNTKERLELINSKCNNLLQAHDKDFSMYSDLKEQRDQLRKIAAYIAWISFALGMKKQLEEDKITLAYDIVKTAFEDLQKLELPPNRGICKLVAAWHAIAESLRKTFEEGYEKKRVQVVKIDVEGEDIQKLITKNKNKLKIDDAHQMIQNLENGTKVVSLYDEAEIIKRDINELKIWKSSIKMTDERVSTYFNNFDQQNFNKLNFEFDDINFRMEINRLKVDMLNLPIRDEDCERNLQLLDFKYESSIIVYNLKKDITFDEWRKVLKKGEKLSKTLQNHHQLEEIITSLKNEIEVAERLKTFASKFKKSESQETFYFEEVDAALEEFNHCKIQLHDDQKIIEDSLHKAQTLQQKVHDLLKSEETSRLEFNVILSSLKDQQFDLSFEQQLLKNAINQAEEIDRAQRRGVEWRALTEVQQEKFIQDCNQIRDKVNRANNPFGNNVTLAQIKLKIHEGNQLRKDFPEDDRLEQIIQTLQDIQTRVEQELKEIFQISDLTRLQNYSFKTNNILELIVARNKRKSALQPGKPQESTPRRRGRPSKDQVDREASSQKSQEKITRPFKPQNEIIGRIQTIIEQSKFLKLNETDASFYAKKVFYALPELLRSEEQCKKILVRLRALLELRYIANSILDKGFDDKHIRGFMLERLSKIKLIEQDLKQKANDQEKGKIPKPEISFYSPEKIQKKISGRQLRHDKDFNNRKQLEKPPMTPIPKNSVLKIFSGTLEWGEINSNPKIILYTCSDLNTVINIPSIPTNFISITNEIPWSNFQNYFSQTLKKWEFREKDSDIQIIAGWIEAEVSIYRSALQRISQELNENEQVGIFKYNQSSTIIIMGQEQMKTKWSEKLDFRVRKVRQNSELVLYFVIVHKPYKLTEAAESLAPELVEIADEEPGKESARKPALFESAPNTGQYSLAPSSLVQEDDFGAITGEEYFAQPFPSSFLSNERSGQGEMFGSPLFSGSVSKTDVLSRSQLEKRPFERIETRDEEVDQIEQLVKKLKGGISNAEDKDEIIEQLQSLDETQVNEIAQQLDESTRNQIATIFQEIYSTQIEVEEEPSQTAEQPSAQTEQDAPHHHHHHKEIINEGEVEIESESPEPEHAQEIESTLLEPITILLEESTLPLEPVSTSEPQTQTQPQEETDEPDKQPEKSEEKDKEDFDDFFNP